MSENTEPSPRIVSAPLAPAVARFGTPLALGMGLQTAFNLVDAYIIGRLQPELAGSALGAIGICDQLAALGSIVSYGLTVASGALLSRYQGEADPVGVRRIAIQSLLLVLALSLLFAAVGVLGAPWLIHDAVGAKGAVAALSVPYLRVMMGGSFTIFLLLHLTGILRAIGSSKTPVALLVGANVLNLVLAILLVYGPGPAPELFAWGPPLAARLGLPRMELQGAAWATLIARAVAILPLGVIVARRFDLLGSVRRFIPDLALLRRIANLAWPSSAQLVVRIVAMLFTHALVARAFTTLSDQTATTALGIVFRLETMALFVGLGWGSAAQTFIGQNLGAGQLDRAKQSGWYAALFNALMMAALVVIYYLFGAQIISLFDDDPRILDVALSYIRWVGPSYVALGVGVVLGSAIQGAGATRQALKLDALVVLLIQLPLSAFVVSKAKTPIGLWQTVALTYVAFALVHAYSYSKGNFLRHQVAVTVSEK
ncbi:MAG TPA: MATE family efflux transporter [Polyangiaceae bacterium]|nr:MATE family efflux transporter [Polyangiaceae bacterium]